MIIIMIDHLQNLYCYMYIGQCTCTSVKMTLHCPAVCLQPPRGVTWEEVANIGSCLIFLLTEGKFCFVCIIQRSPSNEHTLKWGHLDEQERFCCLHSPCPCTHTVPCVPRMSRLEMFHCILLHRVKLGVYCWLANSFNVHESLPMSNRQCMLLESFMSLFPIIKSCVNEHIISIPMNKKPSLDTQPAQMAEDFKTC